MSLSPVEELWLLEFGQRLTDPKRTVATAGADLVVLDTEHPDFEGRSGDQLLDAWIFSASPTPVRDVMVGGEWVVREGRRALQEQVAQDVRPVLRRLIDS